MEREPFTKEEKQIMDLLVEAHNKFISLNQTHTSDITEWVNGIHILQNVIGGRVLRRDYPNTFKTVNRVKTPPMPEPPKPREPVREVFFSKEELAEITERFRERFTNRIYI